MKKKLSPADFASIYAGFKAPIAAFDCGKRCAPHNERGVPFCCDTRHAVPAAYQPEWDYLQAHTDLWNLWEPRDEREKEALDRQTPEGQVLIACLGHTRCQRDFRSLTCRAFPFFPYVTREGEFIGLSYFWEYQDRCWVISNLAVVTREYVSEFIATFDALFEKLPQELDSYRQFSGMMRRTFGRRKQAIPLLHRNGGAYKITPRSGRQRRVPAEELPKHGPYKIAAELPFREELIGGQ